MLERSPSNSENTNPDTMRCGMEQFLVCKATNSKCTRSFGIEAGGLSPGVRQKFGPALLDL
jgi:hypothetical protein